MRSQRKYIYLLLSLIIFIHSIIINDNWKLYNIWVDVTLDIDFYYIIIGISTSIWFQDSK